MHRAEPRSCTGLDLIGLRCLAQRVLSTHTGNTYPNHKGNYYYRDHTLYHIGTLDLLGWFWDVIVSHDAAFSV